MRDTTWHPPAHTHRRPATSLRDAPAVGLWLGLALLCLSLLTAATHGAYALQWQDAWQLWRLWQHPVDAVIDADLAGAQVFWHIRAPRLAMALLAGMGMGLSGALVQGLFRNPLADPGLIGVSAGAALGAAGFIVLGSSLASSMAPWLGLWLPDVATRLPGMPGLAGLAGAMFSAFIGGLGATAIVWRLARQQGHVQVHHLLLVGLAINALAASGLGLMSHLADDTQLRALSFWLLGSLAPSRWPAVLCVLPAVALALALGPRQARALNTLALGEAQARLSGVDVLRLQRHCVWLTALAVGAVTAVIGMVGFIGLLAPHAARLLLGPNHRWVLPGSALLGASLVLLGDAAARTLFAPIELPLGVLTGLIGAPTFLWMLRRRHPRA